MTRHETIPLLQAALLLLACLSLLHVKAAHGSRNSATLSLNSNADTVSGLLPVRIPFAGSVSTADAASAVAAAAASADAISQAISGGSQKAASQVAAASNSLSGSGCPREYSEPLPPSLSDRKFLLLGAVKEQMSKGRLHLIETMALARLLNRTLILPQVGPTGDSIRFDHTLPACAYFDAERIGKMVPWVTQSYFLQQAEQAGRPISTKTIMVYPQWESCGGENVSWKMRGFRRSLFSRDMDDKMAQRVICVKNENSASPVTRGQNMMKALQEGRDADVLVLVKFTFSVDLVKPAIQEAESYLEYSPHLHRQAEQFLASHLTSDFVAIHWRIEWAIHDRHMRDQPDDAKVLMLNRCKRGLIATAKNLLQQGAAATGGRVASLPACVDPSSACKGRVFLATDLTLIGDNSRSMTSNMGERVHAAALDAVKKVVTALGPARGKHVRAAVGTMDEGQEAIVEKLVAMKSGVFVMPPAECGSMKSSFTREIVTWRQKHNLPVLTWQVEEE